VAAEDAVARAKKTRSQRRATSMPPVIILDYTSRMRLLLLLGVLLFVPGALGFFWLLDRGTDSLLVYLTAGGMYLGLALALYASVILWGND
jgi:hypothetical protein